MVPVRHFELVAIANEFLATNYNMTLDVPLVFNPRLKSVLGRFMTGTRMGKRVSLRVELSINFLENQPKEHIIDVLKHELVHYALFESGKPYKDGQSYFENELKRLGVNRTRHYSYAGDAHKYVCEECGHIYHRKRKLNPFARCGCTPNSKLRYEGVVSLEAKTKEKVAN